MSSAEIHLRAAQPSEAQTLSQLAISSKASWGYSDEQMSVFSDELTMSAADFATRITYIAQRGSEIVAFYALLPAKSGKAFELSANKAGTVVEDTVELDDLFVAPAAMGMGCGRHLFVHACAQSRALGYGQMLIMSDPNAAGFYEKMGCRKLRDIASSIPGRTIPLFCFNLVEREHE